MDYFSKFKKRIVAPKVQPTSAMQLSKFHKCWDYVHNVLMMEQNVGKVHVDQTEIPENLRHMVDMLVDEEARQEDNTTGVCMEYLLKNGVLEYLVNVSEKVDSPADICGETIRMIASMIDLLDDRFLVHHAVHKPTIKLLRFCVLDDRQSDIYHEDLVDLMYIICSKIYGFPALLNIFFHDKQWLTTPQKSLHMRDSNSGAKDPKKPEYEFLLFTYLLRFVHREGRSGDFARTGLLFLMEMATEQLGDFILESDFASIMAAGLGALYSQLPRKLMVNDEDEINSSSASYLLGQDRHPRLENLSSAEQSNSKEFKLQLDSFLKLLEFCQDVLTRCPHREISVRLLQSVRSIFLENILYPSILECSDMDGSSVAVISYIDLILQTLQQDALAEVVVGFLMNEEDQIIESRLRENGIFLLAGLSLDVPKPSPYFTTVERFTLKDLIFTRLQSNSQSTVVATLKLLKTLIVKHCRYSLQLLAIEPDIDPKDESDGKTPSTWISHHIREMTLYFSLVSAIDSRPNTLTLGYEEYLQDVEQSLECDCCYQRFTDKLPSQDPQTTSKSERRRSFKYGDWQGRVSHERHPIRNLYQSHNKVVRHRIKPADPLLQILLSLLSHFFTQSSELNLALTSVVAALATCPYRSLEGWISFRESDQTTADDVLVLDRDHVNEGSEERGSIHGHDIYAHFDNGLVDEDDEDDDRSIDYGVEKPTQMRAPVRFKSYPPIFTLLRTLTQQVDYYRSEIDGFDTLLEERWRGLLLGESDVDIQPTPSTSLSTRRMQARDQPPEVPIPSRSLSTFFGVSPGKRRPPPPATSSSVPTVNPSKSLSSSTTAAALAAIRTHEAPLPVSVVPVIVSNPLSHLAIHAAKTQNVRIQPLFPSNFVSEEPILDLDDEDIVAFAPQAHPSKPKRNDKSTEITLAMILNNVVILEEAIKELAAIMQVRRSLGIDAVRYT
ncbi:Retinoic acid induced 16-like protein-domain-containing protein [Phycomyces nitens]|nr:Retinoic acid induced 16-like protein-domain-containing protein [Phycomyces nitens]